MLLPFPLETAPIPFLTCKEKLSLKINLNMSFLCEKYSINETCLEWGSYKLSISWIKTHANQNDVTLVMDFLTSKCCGVYSIFFQSNKHSLLG